MVCLTIRVISKGNFVGNEKFQALNQVLDRLATKYGVTSSTIAISWILRYPAKNAGSRRYHKS